MRLINLSRPLCVLWLIILMYLVLKWAPNLVSDTQPTSGKGASGCLHHPCRFRGMAEYIYTFCHSPKPIYCGAHGLLST